MRNLIFVAIILFSHQVMPAQENSTIEFPQFEDISPNWVHLIIDTTLIDTINNGTGHIITFGNSRSLLDDDFFYDLNYIDYNTPERYINGFLFEKLDLKTGLPLFNIPQDSRINDHEEIPLAIENLGTGKRIFTARNIVPPNPNLPMIIFNAVSNIAVYEFDDAGALVNYQILNSAANPYEFVFPGNTVRLVHTVGDTVNILRQYGVINEGQPTFAYLVDKVNNEGSLINSSDTIYMNVDITEESSVSTIRGSVYLTGENYILNHSRLSGTDNSMNTVEVLVINKSSFDISRRIDCRDFFELPSDFRLYQPQKGRIILSNDQDPDPLQMDFKLIVLDSLGNLIESINSLNNTKGYNYNNNVFPIINESGTLFLIARNFESNSIDILKTDGSGNLELLKEISFSNPNHFMVLTEVFPRLEKEEVILKGFLRKDTTIMNQQSVVGRWNYIISVDIEDMGISTSLSEDATADLNHQILYPNPTNNEVYIDFEKPFTGSIELYSIQGSLIQNIELYGEMNTSLKLGKMLPGCYFIHIYSDRNTSVHKIIRSR